MEVALPSPVSSRTNGFGILLVTRAFCLGETVLEYGQEAREMVLAEEGLVSGQLLEAT